jgi:hypothetical protein
MVAILSTGSPGFNATFDVTAQMPGFGVQEIHEAGAIVFAILPDGRLGPAAIRFGQLLLSPEPHLPEQLPVITDRYNILGVVRC